MKSTELTKEHKTKLLEMCKVLFPEYLNIQFRPIDYLQFSGKHNFHIHWFEFCIIYIFPKLNQWFNAHQLSEFLYQTIGHSKGIKPNEMNSFPHPVDYLYEQFLKLKK
jgi:hypothetical protein